MVELFTRGVMIGTLLMLGFILGILYTNHINDESSSLFTFNEKNEIEPVQDDEPTIYDGLKKDPAQDLKIEMEDDDQLVIYDDDVRNVSENSNVRQDLSSESGFGVQPEELNNKSFISEMGSRTANFVEGIFRGIFSFIG
ncbi:hypothetical protein [Evansella halocellulosilytica]|uniref:hypothetical protein n=1 Tax=Evansella halocellulosilytica TaxID=2011013 RepID=UPI000BB75F29|nr:hypothetical protein [Evansella halocellulosilytica]